MRSLILLLAALTLMVTYMTAGQWAMLGALVLMIVVHELGHWLVARSLGFEAPVFSIGFGSSPRLVLGKIWGTEFQITPWLFGGYVKFDPNDANVRLKAAWKRGAVIVAGVTMNVILALVVVFGLFSTTGERMLVPSGVVVQQVSSGSSPAAVAGVKAGDHIVSIDNHTVVSSDDVRSGLSTHQDGTPVHIVVQRGADKLAVDVTPDKEGHIGVMMQEEQTVTYHKMGPVEAAGRSVAVTWDMGTKLIYGLAMMAHIVPPPPGLPAGATDVHGLVAIVQMGGMAFANGLYSFGFLVAFMSMNLALFNILPIPLLDGGHLMYLIWEKVTGKPVSAEWQGRIGMVFMALLFGLMLFGLFNDLFHPVG